MRRIQSSFAFILTATMILAACQLQSPGSVEGEPTREISADIIPTIALTAIAEAADIAGEDLTPTVIHTPTGLTSETQEVPTEAASATVEVPEHIKAIDIVNRPEAYVSAPEVKAEDMRALSQTLMERFLAGQLGSFPPESQFVNFSYSISGYKWHGITKALYPLAENKDLYPADKRWYFVDSVWKQINPDGSFRYLAHYFVQQRDGTAGQYFANLGPRPISTGDKLVNWIIGKDGSYAGMPVHFDDAAACLEFVPGDTAYCDTRLAQEQEHLDAYKEWAQTGQVPTKISNGELLVVAQGQGGIKSR